MSTESIASSTSYVIARQQQSIASTATPVRSETRNDADKDDRAIVFASPSPTVNLNGQVVGTMIDTIA
ncbi:hypothetical protein [Propionivibrio dicarboxylicus]|uniref:Uncharacterized protein n=1 Tax=Propionivibrio dicarboxylicus TaxID=83767 RepID=A0A1G7YF18_9RHOO|nr:hypothetical protein [Propionivibrio dicarboxylicus]SDG94925.1 hypothetical protein SAMN05660652_00982 [Propionivibrio dicarboxylicus]